jgi:hypothetical protein
MRRSELTHTPKMDEPNAANARTAGPLPWFFGVSSLLDVPWPHLARPPDAHILVACGGQGPWMVTARARQEEEHILLRSEGVARCVLRAHPRISGKYHKYQLRVRRLGQGNARFLALESHALAGYCAVTSFQLGTNCCLPQPHPSHRHGRRSGRSFYSPSSLLDSSSSGITTLLR